MGETITLTRIAELVGATKATVSRRASKESWPFVEICCRGGCRKEFPVDSLPEDIRTIHYKRIADEAAASAAQLPVVRRSASAPAVPLHMSEGMKEGALYRADLLRLYQRRLSEAPYGQKSAARDQFMAAYNAGLLYPKLFEKLGPTSWKTVEGWKRDLRGHGDCFVLADRRGSWRRGASLISPIHEKILLACLLHPNAPRIAEGIRFAKEVMSARGIENGYSEATYRRWLERWIDVNHGLWTYTRGGFAAWNRDCADYAERDYDKIGVGDVLVADGHVLNFEVINPWTGKPKRMVLLLWYDMKSSFPLGWEIMPTENTQAIASSLRWAILRLGKIPSIAYLDNGKAFGAKFFEGSGDLDQHGFSGLFERLGIRVIHARPYRAQSKTVERFFGTFGEVEREAVTFVGISTTDKPPGMMRGERLHRKLREKMVAGGITLEQAHMAVAEWFDRYSRREQQSGHLKGQRPVDVFLAGRGPGVDREVLNDLMMSFEIKHIRKGAITMPGGRRYKHDALMGRRHKAIVRYDFQSQGSVLVYDTDGNFICEALISQKVHPAADYLGTDADRQILRDHCETQGRHEKDASALARHFLDSEVLPVHQERMRRIGVTPQPLPAPAPRITDNAVPAEPTPAPQIATPEDWARIQAEAQATEVEYLERPAVVDLSAVELPEVMEDAAALRRRLEAMPEPERYAEILAMEIRGQFVPERWRDFVTYFEGTMEYLDHRDRYEELRGRLAIEWQAEAAAGGP